MIKEYKISLLTVIIASIVSFLRLYTILNQTMLLQTLTLNTLFILTLLGVLLIYCRIRHITFLNAFGLGDILFLGVALFSFAPFSFVMYIITSSLLGILYFFFLRILGKGFQQIPYAGIMAAVMLVLFIIDLSTSYSTFSDNWLFQF